MTQLKWRSFLFLLISSLCHFDGVEPQSSNSSTSTTPLPADQDEDCIIDEARSDRSAFKASVIAIYILCFLCAVTLLVCLCYFIRQRQNLNIAHRHPRLVYCTVAMVIVSNLVLFPLAIDYWVLECVTHTPWLRRPGIAEAVVLPIEAFLMVMFVVILLAWLILVVIRVWLLRFDYALSLATKGQIWKRGLEIDGGGSVWWIRNKQRWSKENFLFKILLVPYLAAVLLSIAVSPIFSAQTGIQTWTAMVSTVGTIALILCVFVVVNVWKVREIHDNFHIKDEVLLFAKSSLSIAAILVIVYAVSLLSPPVSKFIVLIWSLLVMSLVTAQSYIQTGWVLTNIRRTYEKSQQLIKSIHDEWESNISLFTVLNTKEGFEVFMDFLVAEYSSENLLCYVEATQFLKKWKFVIFRLRELINTANVRFTLNNFDLKQKDNADELVLSATKYVEKKMEKMDANDRDDESDEVEALPWVFHDKESVWVKFEWIKLPPVMRAENMTMRTHFEHLRQKYILPSSDHQVNVRSALYRHYTHIKDDDCHLNALDIVELLTTVDGAEDDEEEEKSAVGDRGDDAVDASTPTASPNITAPNSPQMTSSALTSNVTPVAAQHQHGQEPSYVHVGAMEILEDQENDEELSAAPGSGGGARSSTLQPGQKKHFLQLQFSTSDTRKMKRAPSSMYNRNLRNLSGVPKVLQMVEDTRKELWKNMNDSFVRFRSTESYIDYIKQLHSTNGNKVDEGSLAALTNPQERSQHEAPEMYN